MKKEKKKIEIKDVVFALIPAVIGAVAGLILASKIDSGFVAEESIGDVIKNIGVIGVKFLLLYLAFFIQLIVHEGGHLVFGLLTGYKFVSFRIANLMLVKTKQGYKFCRMALTGTGGQCLLMPPEAKDGKYPCVLYMLGGVIMNALVCIPFVFLMIGATGLLYDFALAMFVVGLMIIATNGIPLKFGGIANDGYNALHMLGNEESMLAMHKQLSINALQMEGLRLREMPDELFETVENADLHNPLISTILVFRENRLMDKQSFDEAAKLIEYCLSDEVTVLGIYKAILEMDRYYIQLLNDPAQADDSFLKDSDVVQTMRSMKKNPTVIRTRIADAALKKSDDGRKMKLLAFFDRVTPCYPAQGEVASEKDLIATALNRQEKSINS